MTTDVDTGIVDVPMIALKPPDIFQEDIQI
jgi:hypothetical protein